MEEDDAVASFPTRPGREHHERIDPELTNPIDIATHIERYKFASGAALGRVLDLGCGVAMVRPGLLRPNGSIV